MVMRADAYARFQACAPLLALRARGATFDLTPPTAAELEEIVTHPVAASEPPLAFGESDPPVGQRLVADAQGGDALPLLQMTLERLYKAQEARADGILRVEDYKGMAAAVTETADDAMAHLGAGGRGALDALVAGLVADVATDPVTAEPLPVVVALDRYAFVRGKPDRAALVDAFVEARLLTLEGGARLRPTHDTLLRIWPDAAALVKEMAALIRARHALLPLAQAWVEAAPADKAEHLEVSAPLLVAGRQLEARFGEDLGTPFRPFIAEALGAEVAERGRETRRRRLIFGATVAALAVMTVLAGAAAWQWRDAVAQRTAAVAAKNEADTQKAVAIQAKNDAIAQKAQADQAKTEAMAQKAAAEDNLALATSAANSLVFDIAQKFRDVSGVPASLIKSVLDRTRDLQEKLLGAGQSSPELLAGEGVALEETSLTLSTLGDTAGALEAARKEAAIFKALHERQPGNYGYQLSLTHADIFIGDDELEQGQLAQALNSYRSGLAIAEPLFKSNPTDGYSQNDLTALYQRIGTVEDDEGQFAQALNSYRKARRIFEGLLESNPGNALFESNLKGSDDMIGDVEKEQEQYAEALDQYRAGFAIAERLADGDPSNTGRQDDLLLSYLKVGELEAHLAQAAKDLDTYQAGLAQALDSYRAGLAIADKLAKSDPDNAHWQRGLSVCDMLVGEVEAERGELAKALEILPDRTRGRRPLCQDRSRQRALAAPSCRVSRKGRQRRA